MTIGQLEKFLFGLLVVLAPMSITMWNKPLLVVIVFVDACLLCLLSISGKKVMLTRLQAVVLTCYVTLFAIGFMSLVVSSNDTFGILLDTATLGRILTVCISSITLCTGAAYINSVNEKELQSIGRIFLIPGAVFILFGFYQVYCNVTGVPFLIETRDWMHGVPTQIRSVFPKRVTSIAEEPSFVAPVLVEFLILSAFIIVKGWKRNLAVTASLSLLILTFSGGAYVNTLAILAIALFLMICKYPLGKLHMIVGFMIASSIIFLIVYGQVIIEYSAIKFANEISGGSSRSKFMVDLVSLTVESNPWSVVFGHGVTSLSYLGEYGLRAEDALFRISNNMFVDLAWESGVLGVFVAVLMYACLFRYGIAAQIRQKESLSLTIVLVSQSLLTSFYRSEYISTHMIWVLLAIFWAVKYDHSRLNK